MGRTATLVLVLAIGYFLGVKFPGLLRSFGI